MPLPSLYYDKNDYKLLEILNDLVNRGMDRSHFKTILEPYLRPHGIKELAAEPGLRIGYAIMQLLQSLKSEQSSDRIKALITLRDETMAAARDSMRNNRARVLIQIGKELIRAQGDNEKQLELAHDFRRAALGKVGLLRRQLKRCHLLEMPEEWNQITFDDRVHDANSKGRKSATHLIMDAWVKGIRHLTVVYYDFMEPSVARELFASARILGVSVRVGIEYRALHRGRLVKIVWSPNGLQDDSDRDEFFRQEAVQELMRLGRQVQDDRTRYVRAATERFNDVHRKSLQHEFGILPPVIEYEDVAKAIGTGQPSIFHLGNFIHEQLMPLFTERVAELRQQYADADYDAKAAIGMQLESLDSLDAETIVERYLVPSENPGIPDPDDPNRGDDAPALLRLTPAELTSRLRHACPASQLTLILADLKPADVIEILYDCEGRISHFEIFNIKFLTELQVTRRLPISKLQQAINEHNAVTLKRMIHNCILEALDRHTPDGDEQAARLGEILTDFHQLLDRYRRHPLRGVIGSGSTGRSTRTHGMGFAVLETLPLRAQREVRAGKVSSCIPVVCDVTASVEFEPPRPPHGHRRSLARTMGMLHGLRNLVCARHNRWRVSAYRIEDGKCGNVFSLGGMNREGNGLQLYEERKAREKPSVERMNTTLKNVLKVLFGFIPAFLTFFLTKDWWVLAYLGGVIWFAITGVRNVIQSVLGGGGLRRSAYLTWHDYIDWERIADSLLYTGFSVPLLDWLCKSVVLDQGFGVTTATAPLMLYTIMALTNGTYITTHNLIRGLPRKAALGNFFRSVFSIPVAFAFNMIVAWMLALHGVTDTAAVLQLWAAVISKFASDCVAGIIEGLADRGHNIAMRNWDYAEKIHQIFELFAQLEIAFPTRNMLETLAHPTEFIRLSRASGTDHVPAVMANALDLLYMRMYKPRAREALHRAMAAMSGDELDVFLASQQILGEEKEVAMLFVNGLVGRNFSKALSFYLVRYRDYLDELERVAADFRHRPAEDDESMPEAIG